MEQQIGSKLGKEYVKAVCHPTFFNLYAKTIMQNGRLDETQVESRLWEKYQQPQICR